MMGFNFNSRSRSARHRSASRQKPGLYFFPISIPIIAKQIEECDVIVKKVVSEINSNPGKFNETLVSAASAYKNKIKDKYFRNAGLKRAEQLIAEVKDSKSHLDSIKSLQLAIKDGNENHDSLKTFLFHSLTDSFCKQQKPELTSLLASLHFSYYFFLQEICKNMQIPKKALAQTC